MILLIYTIDFLMDFLFLISHTNNLGKANLTDAAWFCPTNAAHRFFKVKVEMP